MALELALFVLRSPVHGVRTARALSAYRHAHEEMRRNGVGVHTAERQLDLAAAACGVPATDLGRMVQEWMLDRPLKHLARWRAEGLEAFLALLERAGALRGVLSDYPVEEKIAALGLAGRFSPLLCSTSQEIAALKPSPRGFARACEIWGLPPSEVLMVGDRADVDAAGAAAAGMPAVILGSPLADSHEEVGYRVFSSFERLGRVLEGH